MKTIYFVRHGSTESLEAGLYQKDDDPLSQLGKEQAQAIAASAQNLEFTHLITSKLKRAQETAKEILRLKKVPYEEHELLNERRQPSEVLHQFKVSPETMLIQAEVHTHQNEPGWHYSDEENHFDVQRRTGRRSLFL